MIKKIFEFNCRGGEIRFEVDSDIDIFSYMPNNISILCPESVNKVNFVSKIRQVESFSNSIDSNSSRVGKNLVLDKNKISIQINDWMWLSIECDKDCPVLSSNFAINIEVTTYNPLTVKNLGRRLLGMDTAKKINNERSILAARMAVHYPLFYLLETKFNVNLLHASSTEKDGNGYIFTGFSGAGKSTVAYELMRNHEHRILSDNFTILTNDNYIIPFYEGVKLRQNAVNHYSLKSKQKVNEKLLINKTFNTDLKKEYFASRIFLLCYENSIRTVAIPDYLLIEKLTHSLEPEFIDYKKFKDILSYLLHKNTENQSSRSFVLEKLVLGDLSKLSAKLENI